jgi:hypothetical protein
MRVLLFFFKALVTLGVIAVVGFFAGREIVIRMAVADVRSVLSVAKKIGNNPGSYAQQCYQLGSNEDQGHPLSAIQIKFSNNTDYVLEVVCAQLQLSPIQVSTHQLKWGVKKVAGTSGIVWGDARSGVILEFWGKRRAVIVENQQIIYTSAQAAELGTGPVASCQGYGFQCCAVETSQGVGDQLTGVTDCPRTCFAQCQARPVVLSFTTEPFFENQSRSVHIGQGDQVSFSFVASSPGKTTLSTTLSFGDGQEETLAGLTGSTSHTYACNQVSCSYEAQLKVVDSNGVAAADTPVTKLTVVVSGQ